MTSRLDQLREAQERQSQRILRVEDTMLMANAMPDLLALADAAEKWEALLKDFQETEYDREADYQLKLAERDLSDSLARFRAPQETSTEEAT